MFTNCEAKRLAAQPLYCHGVQLEPHRNIGPVRWKSSRRITAVCQKRLLPEVGCHLPKECFVISAASQNEPGVYFIS